MINNKGRALEDELADLHGTVARALANKFASGEFTAADINAAIKFLKDNNINCDGTTNPDLKALTDGLPIFDEMEMEHIGLMN